MIKGGKMSKTEKAEKIEKTETEAVKTVQKKKKKKKKKNDDTLKRLEQVEQKLVDLTDKLDELDMHLEVIEDEVEENNYGYGPARGRFTEEEPILQCSRKSGVYTFRFRGFAFFHWVGVLTLGALLGVALMGIFG